MSGQEVQSYKDKIKRLLKQEDTVLEAHYYVDSLLQELAEETGGCVSDSLQMARFGTKQPVGCIESCVQMGQVRVVL